MLIHKADCLFLFILSTIVRGQEKVIIGGFFENDYLSQKAFNISIDVANRLGDNSTDEFPNIFFEGRVFSSTEDILQISDDVCNLVKNGVAAIFGPHNKLASTHVQSMCDTMDIPNIVAQWDSEIVRTGIINLYPPVNTLSKIFPDLIAKLQWNTLILLYDSLDGLIRTNQLLECDGRNCTVYLQYLGSGPNFRDILAEVKDNDESIRNLLIDCTWENLERVLLQSQQVGLMSKDYNIIVSSLDVQILDLEPFQYSGVNFVGIRLVNPADHDSQQVQNRFLSKMGLDNLSQMPLNSALMYDAVQLFARAFKQFRNAVNGRVRSLSCHSHDNWEYGTILNDFLQSVEMKGLTGLIKFHANGLRSDFQIDIVQLTREGLHSIGSWNHSNGIKWIKTEDEKFEDETNEFFEGKLGVFITMVDPFSMLKEFSEMHILNDRYEGYAIDIIEELSKTLNFEYILVEEEDDDEEQPNSRNRWTKIIDELQAGNAAMAVSDLTITTSRQKLVDFSIPIMTSGISILYKKPLKTSSLFSFLSPLSAEVWFWSIGAYIFTSVLLFLIGRICPAEWNNPYPCIQEPKTLENQFTLNNALWFTTGSIMQQGSEIAPIGLSTRMVAMAWWFFSLIIVNSYIANLTAFLTVKTNEEIINSVEELANLNGQIKYGTRRGSATFRFFQESNDSIYSKMYQYMIENEDVMTDDDDEGKERVLREDGKYAFLMESSRIQYIIERECSLMQVGKLLDTKNYGIAMKKIPLLKKSVDSAVLQMQESGLLFQLQEKWWKHERGGGKCKEKPSSSASTEPEVLTMENVGGVFLVLVVGIAFLFIYSILEMTYDVISKSLRENLPFCQMLRHELGFVIKFNDTTKPVRYHRTPPNISPAASIRGNFPTCSYMPAASAETML